MVTFSMQKTTAFLTGPLTLFLGLSLFGQVSPGPRQQSEVERPSFPGLAKLTASDGGENNEFGYAVSTTGNVVVVGAPYATVGGHRAQGAVYVFKKPSSGWQDMSQAAKLTASDGEGNAFFGSSVSMSGDTIVVGADGASVHSSLSQGAAYVFVQPASGWADMIETAKLVAPDGAINSYFGSSVSISGDTVVIGADGANVGTDNFAGAVYVFVKAARGWTTATQPSAKLTASDGSKGNQLGYSVAIYGDTVIAGARSALVGTNPRQGAAYLFVKPAGGWKAMTETAKLTAADGSTNSQFGYSVSIDGDVVVVGAPSRDSAGAAYLFARPNSGWTTTSSWTAKMMAGDGAIGGQFGYALSIGNGGVLVGAPSSKVSADAHPGAVCEFTKPGDTWIGKIAENEKLIPSNSGPEERFGSSVSFKADTWVAGAPYATIGSKQYEGAAYVVDKPFLIEKP